MKRALSMLLALVLLLSCFSGMVVSAEEMDETEVVVAPEATEETEPAIEETEEPATEPEATEPAEEPAAEPEATEPEAPAEEAEPELSEAPMETVEWFSGKKSNSDEPATYGATYEHEVPTAFMNYLNQQFAACKTEFDVSSYNIPYAKWEYLKSIIWYETPEWFHVKSLGCSYYTGGKITTIRAGYRTHSDTADKYATCLSQMTKNAEVLLRGIKGNNNLSDVEKALLLHDRLAVFVEYDLGNVDSASVDHKIFAAYSALGEGLSVCQGYALAYMYLLDQVDIESDLCQSDALWHAWNIVYINNKPYHVDVTWDDPTAGNYGVGYYDAFGRVTHVNFLRSTAGIRETGHTAYDYITTPTDTYYDEDCWWMDTNTSIELIGNALYHLDYNNGRVYKLDDSGWTVIYQSGNYSNSKMAKVGTKLLMSQQKNVLLIDPATGSATTVFSPSYAQYSGANIYGMKYENGKITCQINYNGSRYTQSMSYIDESSKVAITKQPQDVMVANGKTATTSVEATGDGLTYVWYFKNPADKTYRKSSVTTNTYSTAMAAAKNGRTVYCVITDLYGNTVTSNVATLRMGNV
ncbi:MAG: hypothetical protein IKU57_05175, partial [Oscillospiraceae bacterium]|nr:hypothetical protein [Oscillospiraceae bacterium]